ncbi:MAG: hypothetical protein PHD29_09465, partial [bacterium]|nr:hypothetical protein [bacterium]
PGICECPSGAGPLYSAPGIAEANASCYTLGFLRDKSIDKALRESLHYGRCFPNLANWALIEDVLVETIHEVLAAIKAGSYSEKMLVDKFNDAAAKAGELLKN